MQMQMQIQNQQMQQQNAKSNTKPKKKKESSLAWLKSHVYEQKKKEQVSSGPEEENQKKVNLNNCRMLCFPKIDLLLQETLLFLKILKKTT